MPKTAAQRFRAEIVEGHKGAAVIVPFDPAMVWNVELSPVPRPWKLGFLIEGTINRTRFEGWIGYRWGRSFILVDDLMQERAGVGVGDIVAITVKPRPGDGKKVVKKPVQRKRVASRGVARRRAT